MLTINVFTMNDLGDKFAHSPVTTLLMDGVSVRLYEDGISIKEMYKKIQEICDKGGNKRIIQKLRLFLAWCKFQRWDPFRREEGDGGDNVILSSFTNRRTGKSILTSTSGDLAPLEALKPYFEKSSTIEVHACNAGKGESGAHFIQALSDFLEVRVIAPETTQTHATTKFEGPHLIKAIPGGKTPIKVKNPTH